MGKGNVGFGYDSRYPGENPSFSGGALEQQSGDNFHTGAIPEGTDADDIQISE